MVPVVRGDGRRRAVPAEQSSAAVSIEVATGGGGSPATGCCLVSLATFDGATQTATPRRRALETHPALALAHRRS